MFRAFTQFWWAGAFAWAEALDSWSGPPENASWHGDAKVVDFGSERRRRMRGSARQK